ncbi:MAG: DegV family protein [Chloroflexota bacterium]
MGVVTDSIACLPGEMASQYGIQILPINLFIGDKVYRDGVDISPTEVYQLFLKDPEHFNTSAPSPAVCYEVFREMSRKTPNIFCVTLSAKLSATYDSARLAKEQALRELPGIKIEMLDSQTAAAALGFIALGGARAAAAGKDLGTVVAAAREIMSKVTAFILLDTVRYVYRSGRIPRMAAQAGSVLNIRPIFTLAGKVNLVGVAASREQGLRRILAKMKERVGSGRAHVAVMHAYAPEAAEALKARVAAEFDCVELWLTEFSPVMGYATGTGTLGVAFYRDSEKAR